ncbi:hypothetical protein RHMOL_Rhmol05G0157800 [Rhododendron molle]|uniref:Uncharacterized protein n=1 Tax=Rhododendron molle TaxID=49168 RepID=A0ACC0NPC6_RHOML|nr:hypothetical protein RHMOL_Rhmol05G0157800 [Rhododendron molle]
MLGHLWEIASKMVTKLPLLYQHILHNLMVIWPSMDAYVYLFSTLNMWIWVWWKDIKKQLFQGPSDIILTDLLDSLQLAYTVIFGSYASFLFVRCLSRNKVCNNEQASVKLNRGSYFVEDLTVQQSLRCNILGFTYFAL